MNLKLFAKKTLTSTCIYFTIIMFLYTLVFAIVNSNADILRFDGLLVFSFLGFSFLFAIANFIFSIEAIPVVLRHILHYIVSTAVFAICVLSPFVAEGMSSIVVGTALFTVIYIIVAIPLNIVKSVIKRKREKKSEYKNQFKK